MTRRRLFTVGLKTWDNIPPSQHALFQHVKLALYVVCFQWKVSLTKNPDYVDPKEWGWTWNDRLKQYVPYWTELPDVSKGCRMLLQCTCKVSCSGRCGWGASRITSDVQLYVHARGPAPTMMTTAHLNIGLQLHKMISIA